MNQAIETIIKRRSIRAYESKPVSKELMQIIIEAGNQAPSAMNSQPWRFVVIEDNEIKKMLLKTAMPKARKILDG